MDIFNWFYSKCCFWFSTICFDNFSNWVLQSKEVKDKIKATNLKEYGYENPMQSKEVQEKGKVTMELRYGYRHALQVPEFSEKQQNSSFKLREYTYKDGTVVKVQGYEPGALKILENEGYTNDDIILGRTEVPEIWYIHEDKEHRYFCDIFIPCENKIIEVKSTWTYEKEEEKNIKKAEACLENGYLFEFWIMDKNGDILEQHIYTY